MLAAKAACDPRHARGPHRGAYKIQYVDNQRTYNILWLASLTTGYEFHFYYDI